MSEIRVCRRCHTAVIPTKTPGYAFACPEHDEDLYDFETELVDTKTKKGLTMTREEKKLIRDYVEIEYEHSNGRNVRIQADGSVTGQVDATPNTNHQAGRIVAGKDTDILRGAKIYIRWGYENHLRSKTQYCSRGWDVEARQWNQPQTTTNRSGTKSPANIRR